jgi:hypothetical protein
VAQYEADCLGEIAQRLQDRPSTVWPEDYGLSYTEAEERRLVLLARLEAFEAVLAREP